MGLKVVTRILALRVLSLCGAPDDYGFRAQGLSLLGSVLLGEVRFSGKGSDMPGAVDPNPHFYFRAVRRILH